MPRHPKTYYEKYAQLSLKEISDYYFNLEHLDKPDLQDNIGEIGIEVTEASFEQDFADEALSADYSNAVKKYEAQLKNTKSFPKGEFTYIGDKKLRRQLANPRRRTEIFTLVVNNKSLCSCSSSSLVSTEEVEKQVVQSILDKMEKIKGYAILKSIGLYIFCHCDKDILSPENILLIINQVESHEQKNISCSQESKKYDFYIFNCIDLIYLAKRVNKDKEYSLSKISSYDISSEQLQRWRTEALKICKLSTR